MFCIYFLLYFLFDLVLELLEHDQIVSAGELRVVILEFVNQLLLEQQLLIRFYRCPQLLVAQLDLLFPFSGLHQFEVYHAII